MDDPRFVEQLKAGVDFATDNPVAAHMQNFVYLVGDRAAGQCLVVDPAWDVAGILAAAEARGLEVTGVLVSHWHPDHVGGSMMGHDVEGLAALLEHKALPIYVHEEDAGFVQAMTGLAASDLSTVQDGARLQVGAAEVECLHTPGHTAGSQCFRCGKALVSGDTLFLEGCGRTDLPGGDVEQMWRTLYERMLALPGDLVLYPGHHYSPARSAPLDDVRRTNPLLQAPDYETFLRLRGG